MNKVRGLGSSVNSSLHCSHKSSYRLAVLLPPGATSISKKPRPASNGREFQFAFHQLQSAIMPKLPLGDTIKNWNNISAALREPSRTRKPQCKRLSKPS